MSLTVDGEEIFGAGPHTVVGGSVARRSKVTVMPGLAGAFLLALGGDRQEILQTGVLVGEGTDAEAAGRALADLVDAINAIVQNGPHALVDAFGRAYANVVLMEWALTGPRQGPTPSQGGASVRIEQPYRARWLAAGFEAAS